MMYKAEARRSCGCGSFKPRCSPRLTCLNDKRENRLPHVNRQMKVPLTRQSVNLERMHNAELILTLTAGLGAALLFGFLALRLRLPPIVGYLVAGLLLGPYTPGFVANRALADQ